MRWFNKNVFINGKAIFERIIEERKMELKELITDKDITYHARIEELDYMLKKAREL